MSTKITADNGATIEVGQLGITVVHPEGTASIWARLSQEQRAALAEAVSPAAAPYSQGREWTRADLPNIGVCQSNGLGYRSNDYAAATVVLDTVVDWLNAHHSKPERGVETGYALQADALTRERDAAVARAILAEQERENWRVTAINRAAPAVSRDEIEKVVEAVFDQEAGYGHGSDKPWPGTAPVASAVWYYLKGDDPAVYVVRESELPDLEMVAARNFDLANGQTKFRDATGDEVDEAVDDVASDLRYVLAARRAIEAEQAVDPVEGLTDNLADILYGDELVTDQMRGVLERVVRAGMLFPGMEADQ